MYAMGCAWDLRLFFFYVYFVLSNCINLSCARNSSTLPLFVKSVEFPLKKSDFFLSIFSIHFKLSSNRWCVHCATYGYRLHFVIILFSPFVFVVNNTISTHNDRISFRCLFNTENANKFTHTTYAFFKFNQRVVFLGILFYKKRKLNFFAIH